MSGIDGGIMFEEVFVTDAQPGKLFGDYVPECHAQYTAGVLGLQQSAHPEIYVVH